MVKKNLDTSIEPVFTDVKGGDYRKHNSSLTIPLSRNQKDLLAPTGLFLQNACFQKAF